MTTPHTRAEHNLYRYEPTPEDIRKAHEHISKHEGHIAALDNEISQLYVQVRRVEEVKRQHMAEILKSKGVLTMARRLPKEILARIFEQCVTDGWTRAPIVASQLCSAWREAAQIPRVWSHLYVDCDKGNPVARCSLWLLKSMQCPLTVTIRANEHHPGLDTVLETLVGEIDRWRNFTLEAPSVRLANYVLSWITGARAYALNTVHVRLTEDTLDDHPINLVLEQQQERLDGLLTTFGVAPNLTGLHLYTDSERCWVGLPSIKHLNLHINECRAGGAQAISESAILNTLNDCPGLQSCSISISRLDARPVELDNPDRVITMSNLTELTLTLPPSWLTLVQHLRTPALENLHLRCPDDPHGYAADSTREAIRIFLEGSAPPLRTLEMYDIDMSQDDFEFMFSQLNRLEELRLHGSEILDPTLLKLCAPTGLLPALKRVDLRWCGHLTGAALAALVQSRAVDNHSSPLEEVTVINCSFVKEQDIINIARHTTCRLLVRDDDYCSEFMILFRRMYH
jgi:hypothetical protein